MGEGGKFDLKNLIARGTKAVEKKLREGAGVLPETTADGQESSKPVVMPTVETQAGVVSVSSAETAEQSWQAFFDSILDKERICLTNKEGTARNYYTKVGNELHNKRGINVTEEASKKYNNGWRQRKELPKSDTASVEGLAQQVGELVSASVEASGDKVEGAQEESKTFKAFREKLAPLIFDVFPKRLEEIDSLTVLNTLRSEERPHIEVIRHNWQSEIGFVYKCLSPEDQKRANVYIKQENRICLDAIEKKEDILIKDAKRQWYAIAENKLPFQKAVAEKAKMIIDAIAVARGLRELKNIGQERFVKVNGEKRKERRFFSVGMFFSKYENDSAMIGVLNSIADQKDSPAEKEISSLWEGKLRSLEEELAPGAKIINDQLSIVISEKRALLQSLTSENKISKQSEIYFSRLFEDLEATAVDFFKDFDNEGLQSVLTRANEIEFNPENTKQSKSIVSNLGVEKIQALEREKVKKKEPLEKQKSRPEGSKEKRYRELRLLMDQSEIDELVGVTGTGLKEVLMHSRNTGKSKKEAAEEIGMDFIIEELLVPAIKEILPSGWSEADKEIFSRAVVLKRIEIFVSEPKK